MRKRTTTAKRGLHVVDILHFAFQPTLSVLLISVPSFGVSETEAGRPLLLIGTRPGGGRRRRRKEGRKSRRRRRRKGKTATKVSLNVSDLKKIKLVD